MLRSFGVVGAIAAAALALVIGILAFNAHSNNDNQPFAGGPSQAGAPNHGGLTDELNQYLPAALQIGGPPARPAASAPANPGPSPHVSVARTSYSGGGSGGGAAAATAPRQAAPCSPGLLGGLLAAVGGILGGSGSAC